MWDRQKDRWTDGKGTDGEMESRQLNLTAGLGGERLEM